jgi:hypothetical protein
MAAMPVTCPAQRSRKMDTERLMASIGPASSRAIAGTARRLITVHAPPTRPATICPPVSLD